MEWTLPVIITGAICATAVLAGHAFALLVILRRSGTATGALSETLAKQAGVRVDVQAEIMRAVTHETSRSVALCLEALAELSANGDTGGADGKALKRALDDRRLFVETLSNSRIRPLRITQIFPGIEDQSVEVGVIDPDTAHVNHVDMLYVCAMARHVRARSLFEFGTFLGRTTYHLARGQDVTEVFTLDLDPSAEYPAGLNVGRAVRAVHERGLQGYFFRGQECARLITQLHGDSRTFDYAPYRGRMDFVFVDGGHTADLIANDTKQALAMLKPGGLIVWHDFAPKGRDVVSFARDLSTTHPLFWVPDTSLLIYVDGVDPMTFDAQVPVYDRRLIKGPPA
jgi:predicted O-methyltransferase YrrM